MLIFIDKEFTGFHWVAKLISIGLVAKQLHEACALRGVSIVGVAGGWSAL